MINCICNVFHASIIERDSVDRGVVVIVFVVVFVVVVVVVISVFVVGCCCYFCRRLDDVDFFSCSCPNLSILRFALTFFSTRLCLTLLGDICQISVLSNCSGAPTEFFITSLSPPPFFSPSQRQLFMSKRGNSPRSPGSRRTNDVALQLHQLPRQHHVRSRSASQLNLEFDLLHSS